MTQRRHLDDLFSAAYENDLSPIDDARFHSHIQSCEPCAEAYAEFRATIEALHELPRARMPHVVHLPSTPPVAEHPPRPRIGLSWFNPSVLRRFPATAAAGAIAVVLVIVALTHGASSPLNSTASVPRGGGAFPITAPSPAASEAACTQEIVGITGASPPADFAQASLARDPAEPALHLVLATPSLEVTAGRSVLLYAQLSVPVPSISNAGATAAPPLSRAVRPCVTVSVAASHQLFDPVPARSGAAGGYDSAGAPLPESLSGGVTDSLLSFTVPAGLPPGTSLRVVATVPAGYGGLGTPPLTATLILTTH